jgi:predicted ribosomally synthesized peptide with nif11-like leader
MSIAEINRFQRAMASSPDFGERIRAAGVGLSAIVQAARAEGFGFDLAELKAHMKSRSAGMLSDEELAGVAAAGSTWSSTVVIGTILAVVTGVTYTTATTLVSIVAL